MPAAFAHDLYGRLVYKRLAPEIRRAILKEKDCFYLGLHGPDILFFYRPLGKNPVNRKGYWMHEEPARKIFEHGLMVLREEEDERKRNAIRAYLLGFSCHFALDHSVHGYVNRIGERTKFTHGDVETELERRLLIRERKEPLRTNITCHIKNTEMTWMAAARVLSENEVCLWEAIASFKFINRLFVNSSETVKDITCMVLKKAGYYEEIHGMIMRKHPVMGLSRVTDRLEEMFDSAVPLGAQVLTGVFDSMEKGTPLPEVLSGNFEGIFPEKDGKKRGKKEK